MGKSNSEELIGQLYDLIQDARAMPLAADKCIVERDTVLDILDDIISQLPGEIKQSRTIVESRNELINQARREAENILQQAQQQAEQMVLQENVYAEAKKKSDELINQTQTRVDQIRRAGNDYMNDSLRRTEETLAEAMKMIRETRNKFRSVTDAQEKKEMPEAGAEEEV